MHPADCPRCGTRGIVDLDACDGVEDPALVCPSCGHEWRRTGARFVLSTLEEVTADPETVGDRILGREVDDA